MCFQLKQPQYVTYTTHSIDIFDPAFALKAIDKNTTQDITDDSISNLPFSNSGSPYPSYLQIHMKEWGCPNSLLVEDLGVECLGVEGSAR